MKYFKILIIFFIILAKPAFSFDNFDECGALEKFIKKNQFQLSLDEINYTSKKYLGIRIRYDNDFWEPNIEKVHPNLEFKNQVDSEEDKLLGYDLEGQFITEINGKTTTSLNEEDFYKELDKEIIEIKVENNEKVYQLERKQYENFEIYFSGDIENISSVDSKNGKFSTIFNTETTWHDDRLSKAAYQIGVKGVKNHNESNNEKITNTSFYCKIRKEFLKEIDYWIPNLLPQNFIPDERIKNPNDFVIFSYAPVDDCKNCTDLENKYGLVSFAKKDYYRGVISNPMDLKRFPFDTQRLSFDFIVENDVGFIPEVFHNSSEIIETNLTNLENSEWDIIDAWNGYGHYLLTEFELRLPYLAIYLDIERKSTYFFFKIMLPIIFLLVVSWSTFWITPIELESRVTVSIVCLLSLIAYNFVIDNDLPKLGYLTFMDKFVLTTYIFAGIPTLQTILVRNIVDQDNLKLATYIDKKCKFYIPVSFFAALLYLLINYEIIKISS